MLPSVAVVIPAYNAAAYLPRSLGCVARLDYPADRLQVVVVDDGSTDGTAEVARSLLEGLHCETKLLRMENGGPSAARNAGVEAAAADLIQFLDADDEIPVGKLAAQVPAIAAASPSCAFVYSPWQQRSPDGRVELRDPDLGGDAALALIRTESFCPCGAGLFRREWLVRVGGFDPGQRFIEDVDLELRIVRAGGQCTKVTMQEPSYIYHQHMDSLSRSSALEFYRGCVRNARLAEAHWREAGLPMTPLRAETLLQIYENGLDVFAGVDEGAFNETLRDAVRLEPGFKPTRGRLRALSHVVGVRNAYRLRTIFRHRRPTAAA